MAIAAERQLDISQLGEIVAGLEGKEEENFHRIYKISVQTARMDCSHLKDKDGNPIPGEQTIVKVLNKWTHQVAKFNCARANRPLPPPANIDKLKKELDELKGDAFCNYEETTPKEIRFRSIKGRSCTLVPNLYPFEAYHDVIIFNEHNPLVIPPLEDFLERMDLSKQWIQEVFKDNERCIFPSILQNILDRSGGSFAHGHAQIEVGQDFHEAGMERFINTANFYRFANPGRDYFEDLFQVYQSLGLLIERPKCLIFPSLTPVKEQEVLFFSWQFDEGIQGELYKMFRNLIEYQNFIACNFSVGFRPLERDDRLVPNFPMAIGTIVNRGNPVSKVSDMGASETCSTHNSVIIASDPFRVKEDLDYRFIFNRAA